MTGLSQRVELNWGSRAAHLQNVERSLQDELIYDLDSWVHELG